MNVRRVRVCSTSASVNVRGPEMAPGIGRPKGATPPSDSPGNVRRAPAEPAALLYLTR